MQKLAQVLERRGQRDAALAHLTEALALYEQTYGPGTPHVNVAATLANLGHACLSGKRIPEARQYLLRSLAMRRKIYGVAELGEGADGDGDGEAGGEGHRYVSVSAAVASSSLLEIAMSLCKLGEVEAESLATLPRALSYLRRARRVFDILLARECGPVGSPLAGRGNQSPRRQHLDLLLTAASKRPGCVKLLQRRLDLAQRERKVCRALLAAAVQRAAAEDGHQAAQHAGAAGTAGNDTENARRRLARLDCQVEQVRAALKAAKALLTGANIGLAATTPVVRKPVAGAAALLAARKQVRVLLCEMAGPATVSRVATRAAAVAQQVDVAAVQGGRAGPAAAAFCRDVQNAAADVHASSGQIDNKALRGAFKTAVFGACDRLRATLRELGVSVTD